ncbi:MAG: glycosyltransferase family 2 protein [Dehalobacterium sp.]
MYDKPLVTIAIINYNCKRFLNNCVNSYLNQSYTNMEIIIVDDCSTDGSVELLKEWEHNNENIRCIYHEKNSGGPTQGIQEAIKYAKGKYFQWIASDDYIETCTIQKLVDFLEETNNDYVYCNYNIVDKNNTVTAHWNYTVPTLNEMVYRIFTNCSGVIPMNGLYRLEFFYKNNITWSVYKNNDYSSDTINSLYFIKKGMKYGMINESLINYRVHQDNCSHNIEERLKTSLTVYDYIIKHFDEAVYLPNIDWKVHVNQEQFKNYAIASFFYKKITNYMQLKDLPYHLRYKITKEKLRECISVYINEAMRYIHEGLMQGDAYKNELIELEKNIKIFSKQKLKGIIGYVGRDL